MNRKSFAITGLMALCGLYLVTGQITPRTPAIVYNASASVPLGFYRVRKVVALRKGDLVLVRTPDTVRSLADIRQYLPKSVPMIKGVAALAGDRVCAKGDWISINEQAVAMRQRYDHMGRPMPRWEGCATLRQGDVFLLNPDAPHSFDGRYFGVVSARLILAKVEPL